MSEKNWEHIARCKSLSAKRLKQRLRKSKRQYYELMDEYDDLNRSILCKLENNWNAMKTVITYISPSFIAGIVIGMILKALV